MERELSPQQQFSEIVQKASEFNHALSPLTSALDRINKALEPLNRLSKKINEQPELLEKIAQYLAKSGWYIDAEMTISEPHMFARNLREGNGDDNIAEYYRQRLNAIENKLIERYPHRKDILVDAFDAHKEGKYNLSIPVLLSQADGIWCDRFSTNFFIERLRHKASTEYIVQLEGTFSEAIFSLFNEAIPLWQNERERGSSFNGVNRHLILHGIDVQYGNERNSLMCISFVAFLCWILNDDEECDG